MLEPSDLGRRIMICGPSSSGKSTLAVALGRRLGLPVIHLDTLQHLPGTNWVPRPKEEFRRLHDAAILEAAWVMEGNYSWLMPQRLRRATGIVLIGDNRWANLRRYFWRTLFQRDRVGMLEGAKDSVKWAMIHWIFIESPKALRRYRDVLPKAGLPYIEAGSMRQLKALYQRWGLAR